MHIDIHPQPVEEDDEGSLFGSPPPSPTRGRSPSPALALPSSSVAEKDTNAQNVGIIALPGSQHCSELPINPLALSMSYRSQQNGPTQPLDSQPRGDAGASSKSSTPSLSRASSRAPSAPPARKKKTKSRAASPRPPPPEIPLPDPCEPLPPNWLRSQSALLGHAGLVGGVNTTTLSTRHTQGSSSQNPIVIDDDNVDGSGRPKPLPGTFQTPDYPPPSTKEIVQVLIKQKEVFPILQEILKLFSKGTPTSSEPKSSDLNEPPTKKRKVTVPAGAADWNIPFPFARGQAPERYHSNWEKERQKQLIAQLLALIRAASRKVAFKNRLLQQQKEKEWLERELEHSKPKVGGHYRPETAHYGDNTFRQVCVGGNSRSATPTTSTTPNVDPEATPTSAGTCSDPLPLDQLFSTLFGDISGDANSVGGTDIDTSSLYTPSHDPTPELDDGFMETWNSLFQLFPADAHNQLFSAGTPGASLPFADLMLDANWQPVASASSSSLSTPTMPSTPLDDNFLFSQQPPSTAASDPQSFKSDPSTSSALDLLFFSQEAQEIPPSSSTINDSMIDPELLALSIPANLAPLATRGSGPDVASPPTCGSPMPSMSSTSSYGDFDVPMTPTSAMGDLVSPVIINPSTHTHEGIELASGGGGVHRGGGGGSRMVEDPQVQGEGKGKGKGKEKERGPDVPLSSVLPALLDQVFAQSSSLSEAGPSRRGSSVPKTNTKKLEKKALLKRARERRKLLAEEIVKTRLQLWEMTIEHGVLLNIAKYRNSA